MSLPLRTTVACGSRRLELPSGRHEVGRSPDCAIRINEPGVSRKHMVVIVEGDGASVEDLGSKNGTFLNGHRVTGRAALGNGDRITLGSVELTASLLPDAAFYEEDTQTLDGIPLVGEDDLLACPECDTILSEDDTVCPGCGLERPSRRPASHTMELPMLNLE